MSAWIVGIIGAICACLAYRMGHTDGYEEGHRRACDAWFRSKQTNGDAQRQGTEG